MWCRPARRCARRTWARSIEMTPMLCRSTWAMSFGLLLSLNVCQSGNGRCGKGAPGQAGGLRFGGRRVRRLPSGARSRGPSPNSLRSLRSLRSNMRRQVSLRSALRARATSPVLLRPVQAAPGQWPGPSPGMDSPLDCPCPGSASEAPSDLSGRAFAETFRVFGGRANTVAVQGLALRCKPQSVTARQAVPGRGDFWGGEEHSPEVGARCALQQLTRRRCLNEAERSERSEFDGATSWRAPQRSRRNRRPPRHEPLPGTACRAALTPQPKIAVEPLR